MAGHMMSYGAATLEGGFAGFAASPLCNYPSPLAKKFVYKEKNPIFTPFRRHIFRLKVRTAAEIRLFELQKKYMGKKLTGGYGAYGTQMTNNVDLDHCGWVVPKDEYEVKKLTAYMTSKKMSQEYKDQMNDVWTKVEFACLSTNFVGRVETVQNTNAKIATDEEFMSLTWYVIATTILVSIVTTSYYWWWKFGQQPQYVELK